MAALAAEVLLGFPMSSRAEERNMEQPVTEKPVVLMANGTRIPAVISLTADGHADWGVVIVPGSFLNDIDGNYSPRDGNPFSARPHTYKDLARQLARRGCAALRYARAGAEVLDPAAAADHRHFADRTNVVVEALSSLRDSVPGLKRCALAGHSEGGPVAVVLLSSRPDLRVDAYISLSAPALRIFDTMLQQMEPSAKDGVLYVWGMRVSLDDYKRSLDLVRKGLPIPDDLMKRLPPVGVHRMDEASQRYLREYDEVDSKDLIAKVACPVLIVQGGRDTSVLPVNAQLLFDARKGSAAPTERADFPALQHFYKVWPQGLDPMAAFGLETESDPAVAAAIAAWLEKTGNKGRD
jgi:pimeloyl-ACP methyl ester carboxylesterase